MILVHILTLLGKILGVKLGQARSLTLLFSAVRMTWALEFAPFPFKAHTVTLLNSSLPCSTVTLCADFCNRNQKCRLFKFDEIGMTCNLLKGYLGINYPLANIEGGEGDSQHQLMIEKRRLYPGKVESVPFFMVLFGFFVQPRWNF